MKSHQKIIYPIASLGAIRLETFQSSKLIVLVMQPITLMTEFPSCCLLENDRLISYSLWQETELLTEELQAKKSNTNHCKKVEQEYMKLKNGS